MTIAFYLRCGICVSILFCFAEVFAKDNPGETCTLSTGAKGVCKYLIDCSPALIVVNRGKFPSDVCESEGPQNIVCCEDTSPVTPPTPKPDVEREIPSPNIVTDVTTSKRKPGEVSKQKCKEYAKYVWEKRVSPALIAEHHITNIYDCPFEKLPLIVGGTFASRKEFPHMVLIGYNKDQEVKWGCGGSLISENYVLTASHCIKDREKGLAKLIRVGMANQSDTTHMQQHIISEVRYHPDYQSPSKYHDIALLKLSSNVTLNSYARPACLYTDNQLSGGKAIATGWGDIGYDSESSNDLLKVVLEFFDNQSCNRTYKSKIIRNREKFSDGIVDEWMICAGSHDKIKDACRGDSGGPLQVYYEGSEDVKCMYSIVGVTSSGHACGLSKKAPGIYTRVSSYIKWIEDIVWPETQ